MIPGKIRRLIRAMSSMRLVPPEPTHSKPHLISGYCQCDCTRCHPGPLGACVCKDCKCFRLEPNGMFADQHYVAAEQGRVRRSITRLISFVMGTRRNADRKGR